MSVRPWVDEVFVLGREPVVGRLGEVMGFGHAAHGSEAPPPADRGGRSASPQVDERAATDTTLVGVFCHATASVIIID